MRRVRAVYRIEARKRRKGFIIDDAEYVFIRDVEWAGALAEHLEGYV